jgi:hypothetical protein
MKTLLGLIFIAIVTSMMVPYLHAQVAESTPTPTPTMIPTQCIDFNQDRICEYVVLASGTMVDNPLVGQVVSQ